jgi:hypothetical protein
VKGYLVQISRIYYIPYNFVQFYIVIIIVKRMEPRSMSAVALCFCLKIKINIKVKVKVKVNFTLAQATKAQRGEQRYSSALSLTSALDGVGGQRLAPAASPPPPGKTRYPLYRRLGGPQGRSGRVRKISPPPPQPGFDSRTVLIPTGLSRPTCIFALLKNVAMVA